MMKRTISFLLHLFRDVLIFVLTLLFLSILWYKKTWDVEFETALYQLASPLKGTNADYIKSYCADCLIPAIKIFALFIGFTLTNIMLKKLQIFIDLKAASKRYRCNISSGIRYFIICGRCGLILVLLIVIVSGMGDIGAFRYIKHISQKSTVFEEEYRAPEEIEMRFPGKKRNLVLIYLESMETTYMSVEERGGKPENYIPELTELASQNLNFSHTDQLGGAYQAPGTGWTMAALLATSTGIPYKLPIAGNSASAYTTFLPGVVGLGDILEENGYENYFVCGSDAEFGGRELFFKEHGHYQIYDYNYAVETNKFNSEDKVFWGFDDHHLFEFAREQISEIANTSQPFNFTMLTVDTHHPEGYVCEYCGNQYVEPYANALACSSKQVFDFISWIEEQPWYDNTTIVLVGDHLSMNKTFFEDIGNYQRHIYNCFINFTPTNEKMRTTKNRKFTSFDFFPTILSSMGVEIEGDRLGLGVNLFSNQNTLLEEMGEQAFTEQLQMYSRYYDEELIKSQ